MKEIILLGVENDNTIQIDGDTLLIFIDETGGEYLKDKEFPVFGLGGCAVPAMFYKKVIDEPWKNLRRKLLGDDKKVLHASDLQLNSVPKEHLDAIGNFFINSQFKRIAAIISEKTKVDGGYGNYQIAATMISKRITQISLQNPHLSSIALFFEYSTSGNKLLKKYFRDIDFNNHGLKVNVSRYVASKGVSTGLDVADFIIQAAGAQTRNRIAGNMCYRKDFESIFKKCDPNLQYFLEITRVEDR